MRYNIRTCNSLTHLVASVGIRIGPLSESSQRSRSFWTVQIVDSKRQERILLIPLALGSDDRSAGQSVDYLRHQISLPMGLAWPGKATYKYGAYQSTKTWHFCRTGFSQTWDFGHETSPLVSEASRQGTLSCL